jgi:quercetin dioxygenase-like cupin family protein
MQFVVTGVDDQGRSTILETREALPDSIQFSGYSRTDAVWVTRDQPFELVSQRPPADGPVREFDVPVGGTKWMIVELTPASEGAWHRTNTLDYDVILRGEVTLELETGSVTLLPGDSVVMSGVNHKWIPGPDGLLMSAVLLGVPPAS